MSRLAHAVFAAPSFEAEKRALDEQAQYEIKEAQRIQKETGCDYTEALRLATATAHSTWDDWKAIR